MAHIAETTFFDQFNAGQLAFINWQTRIHLIEWGDTQLRQILEGKSESEFVLRKRSGSSEPEPCVYWEYATHKGWVSSKKEMVTSSGFKVASSMVKKGASAAY